MYKNQMFLVVPIRIFSSTPSVPPRPNIQHHVSQYFLYSMLTLHSSDSFSHHFPRPLLLWSWGTMGGTAPARDSPGDAFVFFYGTFSAYFSRNKVMTDNEIHINITVCPPSIEVCAVFLSIALSLQATYTCWQFVVWFFQIILVFFQHRVDSDGLCFGNNIPFPIFFFFPFTGIPRRRPSSARHPMLARRWCTRSEATSPRTSIKFLRASKTEINFLCTNYDIKLQTAYTFFQNYKWNFLDIFFCKIHKNCIPENVYMRVSY